MGSEILIKRKKVREKPANKKELVADIAKETLAWVLVTALAFVYWVVMLLILSLILLNVWRVRFEQILDYSVILTVITSAAYLGRMLYRRFH
ncbi:hypothetical protein D7V82_07820 [bacterium 1xD8-6]|jgi:hypothetical protein|nr:hypothetical protein D7V72_08875 [bacterium D16-36]RKI70388.1 hypothetical protein D7V82_07820 [bacterium 1xD8-6]